MSTFKAKRLPTSLPLARSGDEYLITVPNYWGRGSTLEKARAALQAGGGRINKTWRIHSVAPDTSLNEYGQMRYPRATAPVILAEHNPD